MNACGAYTQIATCVTNILDGMNVSKLTLDKTVKKTLGVTPRVEIAIMDAPFTTSSGAMIPVKVFTSIKPASSRMMMRPPTPRSLLCFRC